MSAQSATAAITVTTPKVACDGASFISVFGAGSGDDPRPSQDDLGHPRVFLTLVNGSVTCPYCGKQYVLAAGAHTAAH